MKISFIISFILVFSQILLGQIKNANFEDWHSTSNTSSGEDPDFWTSTNILDSANIGIFKSTDAFQGNYALKIIPKEYIYNSPTNISYGVTNSTAFLGHGFYIKDTISFVPSKFTGYYKRVKTNYTNKDTAFIWVISNRTGHTTTGYSGYGDFGFSPKNNYQFFEVNILGDPIADSLGIYFFYESDDTSANNGGYLLIDDLRLEPIVSTHELENITIKAYPNPVSDYLYFEIGNKITVSRIELFDLKGRLIKSIGNIDSPLDIRSIPQGCYILKIVSNHGIGTKKILIE